jgi:hypothetical protein
LIVIKREIESHGVNKFNHPIQKPLLLVNEPRRSDSIINILLQHCEDLFLRQNKVIKYLLFVPEILKMNYSEKMKLLVVMDLLNIHAR